MATGRNFASITESWETKLSSCEERRNKLSISSDSNKQFNDIIEKTRFKIRFSNCDITDMQRGAVYLEINASLLQLENKLLKEEWTTEKNNLVARIERLHEYKPAWAKKMLADLNQKLDSFDVSASPKDTNEAVGDSIRALLNTIQERIAPIETEKKLNERMYRLRLEEQQRALEEQRMSEHIYELACRVKANQSSYYKFNGLLFSKKVVAALPKTVEMVSLPMGLGKA